MVVYSLQNKRMYQRFGVAVLLFVVVFVGAYYLGFLRENCGTDTACFLERTTSCKPTDVVVLRDTNVYHYSMNQHISNCVVNVRLQRVAEGTSADLQALVGKKMTCSIPKD